MKWHDVFNWTWSELPYARQRPSSSAPGSEPANTICQLCADICNAAEECNKHNVEHCKRCASICVSCAEECAVMIAHKNNFCLVNNCYAVTFALHIAK